MPECFPEYSVDLEDVIRDETSGDFTTALLAMLKANKDENSEVDTDLARRDAEVRGKLYLPFLRLGNANEPHDKHFLFHKYRENQV